jgi:hypothetical protein
MPGVDRKPLATPLPVPPSPPPVSAVSQLPPPPPLFHEDSPLFQADGFQPPPLFYQNETPTYKVRRRTGGGQEEGGGGAFDGAIWRSFDFISKEKSAIGFEGGHMARGQ